MSEEGYKLLYHDMLALRERDQAELTALRARCEPVDGGLLAELVHENDALRQVAEVAKVLTVKLQAVTDDPRHYAVWALAQSHLGPYIGLQYGKEKDSLDAALAAVTPEGER